MNDGFVEYNIVVQILIELLVYTEALMDGIDNTVVLLVVMKHIHDNTELVDSIYDPFYFINFTRNNEKNACIPYIYIS